MSHLTNPKMIKAEKISKTTPEAGVKFSPESLSPSEKMAAFLKIFNLGHDPEQNKERKRKFLDLIGAYHQATISSRAINLDLKKEDMGKLITPADRHKKELHDKIMAILLNASLSINLPPDQKALLDHLARNRGAVEQMIVAYFSSSGSGKPTTPSEIFRGEGPFFKRPGDED